MGSVGQYTQGWLPWQASTANTNWSTLSTQTSYLGMGLVFSSAVQNDSISWNVYMDSVTWKIASITFGHNDYGIASVRLDGVAQGTIDLYNAGGANPNIYSEITGIAVSTAGVKTLAYVMATKNAGSSAYRGSLQSVALIRTGGTPSTPGGSDTPGYTIQYLPWMGTKSNTNWATRTQASTSLGGGTLVTDSTAQNNLFTNDHWLDGGTYKVALIYGKDTDQGIFNITGVSGTQTVDGYNGSATANNYTEVTGITVAAGIKTMTVTMATKNASSSAYGGKLNSYAWVRTGA